MMRLHCVQAGTQLPNELLSIIINELASDSDKRTLATLASCRLASHVLCSLATPFFFSSIELTGGLGPWLSRRQDFENQATKLNQLLTQTTYDIAASIRTLTLRCNGVTLKNSINATLTSEILRRLPHIRNFTLESDFSSITKNFSSAIHALCRPNLTTLDIFGMLQFPITFITACPNLRCLRVEAIEFCVNSIFSVLSVIANPRLQFDNTNPTDEIFYLDSLEIDNSSIDSLDYVIFHNQSFAKYFSRIKNFRLKDLSDEDDVLSVPWDIILLASQSLTTLDISWDKERKFHLDICIAAGMCS